MSEPQFGELYIELDVGRALVVQHLSDSCIHDSVLRWYVNDFVTGQAAGMITLEQSHDQTKYIRVGKIENAFWRKALESRPRIKIVCLDGCEEDFIRAGDLDCEKCKEPYRKHPYCRQSQLPESMRAGRWAEFYIHVLCDGRHVKL